MTCGGESSDESNVRGGCKGKLLAVKLVNIRNFLSDVEEYEAGNGTCYNFVIVKKVA